jgi:hypothetical protein
MSLKVLTLLSGTQLVLGQSQTLILPEVHDDVNEQDAVLLENEQREIVGNAIVTSTEVLGFAHLQQSHFAHSAHSSLTSWGAASEAMKELVPGFSITDHVTVVSVVPIALNEPGFTVGRARPVEEPSEDVPPTDDLYKDLDNIATGQEG